MRSWELLSLLLVLAAGLNAAGAVLWIHLRRSPREREKKRRAFLNQRGRLGDAMITDVDGNSVYYSYRLHGVEYSAAQDVAELRELLPEHFECLIGPGTLKYDPHNPANSIVVCEGWSGLRIMAHRPDRVCQSTFFRRKENGCAAE